MSDARTFISQCRVRLDRRRVPEEFMSSLAEITVENSLHMPDVATVVLNDPGLRWIDDPLLTPGTTLEIHALGSRGATTGRPVFDGEIVELEPEFGAKTHRLTVRAFDRLHRLARGRLVRSFQNVTDSDVAGRLASEADLEPDILATRQVHEYLFQNNETNLEFLRQRATAVGYLLYVEGTKLCFKPLARSSDPIELSWGESLGEFRLRMTTLAQVGHVVARGWDPRSRQEIVSEAGSGEGMRDIGEQRPGGAVAREAFGIDGTLLIAHPPIRDQAAADQLARAVADRQAERFIEAEGSCGGNPAIVAGATVRVASIGRRFAGDYFVTSATHRFGASDGYSTQFAISGQTPATLLRLLLPDEMPASRPGLAVGVVTDNRDPLGWGRVKVKYPWLSGEHASDWTRVVAIGGGAQRGIEFLPEIDDEVLVGLEMGDIHHPYIVGGLWNGKDAPPAKNDQLISGGRVQQRLIRSRTGHTIVLDDSDSRSSVTIADRNGNRIVFDSRSNAMSIDVKGDLTIKAGGQVNITGAVINLN
jgi:phage protein D